MELDFVFIEQSEIIQLSIGVRRETQFEQELLLILFISLSWWLWFPGEATAKSHAHYPMRAHPQQRKQH